MNQVKSKKSFFIPSLADILFICVFLVLAFSKGTWLLADADTGYHILARQMCRFYGGKPIPNTG